MKSMSRKVFKIKLNKEEVKLFGAVLKRLIDQVVVLPVPKEKKLKNIRNSYQWTLEWLHHQLIVQYHHFGWCDKSDCKFKEEMNR